MTKRLPRTTLGVGTFSGLGKERIRLLGQSPSPQIQRRTSQIERHLTGAASAWQSSENLLQAKFAELLFHALE